MKKYSVLCFLFGFSMFLAGCAEQEDMRPKRDCPIKQLLLNRSDYPPGSIFDAMDSPIADKPFESAGQSAYYQHSWTDQSVIRYFSNANAIAQYDKVQRIVFNPDEVTGLWETPSILNLDNLSADRHEIACGNVVSLGKRCYMIGQYEEYYVFFRADISENGVTHEMFRDLVLGIDDRLSACISR